MTPTQWGVRLGRGKGARGFVHGCEGLTDVLSGLEGQGCSNKWERGEGGKGGGGQGREREGGRGNEKVLLFFSSIRQASNTRAAAVVAAAAKRVSRHFERGCR